MAQNSITVGPIAHFLGKMWMKIFRWEVRGSIPEGGKFVLVAVPHTSNWDLGFMLAAMYILRTRASWMGKKSLFVGPLGWFLRKLGGFPVDRSSPEGIVEQVADRFRQTEHLILGIAPSGTRKKRDYWKSGFYRIAHSADVPILCGYLDYTNRVACLGLSFHPTGDITADLDRMRAFYAGIDGKYPELTSTMRLREEG